MVKKFWRTSSLLLFFTAAHSFAADPLIVNIDNPNFRKLISATPTFIVKDAKGKLKNLSKDGPTELGRLLTFSGLFNSMAEATYQDVMKKIEDNLAKKSSSLPFASGGANLEAIDIAQWKALGVDSLTIGELSEEKDGLELAIRTIDVNRQQIIIGKKYSKIKDSDFNLVIRRYADLILQAYTGNTGIFSSKLVFVGRKSKNAAKQIYVCDFDGSNVVQITKGNYPHLSPAWSNDGKRITFTSYETGAVDIYSYELASGKKQKLSSSKGMNSGASWSPDDKLIAYTYAEEGDANIFAIHPDGRSKKALIFGSGLDVDPVFSPDNKWLAFVSGRYGNPHIFRAELKWKSATEVAVVGDLRLTYAGWYNAVPSWSPAADKIAFQGYDKDIDRWDLFMMNPDGKELERLTLRAGDNESPSWSPNGQMLVFHSNRAGNSDVKKVAQLFMMNRDGSSQRTIDTKLYEAQTPKWSKQIE